MVGRAVLSAPGRECEDDGVISVHGRRGEVPQPKFWILFWVKNSGEPTHLNFSFKLGQEVDGNLLHAVHLETMFLQPI